MGRVLKPITLGDVTFTFKPGNKCRDFIRMARDNPDMYIYDGTLDGEVGGHWTERDKDRAEAAAHGKWCSPWWISIRAIQSRFIPAGQVNIYVCSCTGCTHDPFDTDGWTEAYGWPYVQGRNEQLAKRDEIERIKPIKAAAVELYEALIPFAGLINESHMFLPEDAVVMSLDGNRVTAGEIRRAYKAVAKASGKEDGNEPSS